MAVAVATAEVTAAAVARVVVARVAREEVRAVAVARVVAARVARVWVAVALMG